MSILALHENQVKLNYLWKFTKYPPMFRNKEVEYKWECNDPRVSFLQVGENGPREVWLEYRWGENAPLEIYNKVHEDISFLDKNFFNYKHKDFTW